MHELENQKNKLVIQQLANAGDQSDTPRILTFYFYCPQPEPLHKLAAWAIDQDYTVPKPPYQLEGYSDYSLKLERNARPILESMNEVTVALHQKPIELGIEYDGWETYVIK